MKAVLLLSTGIDSPVAGYLMQKRGLELIAVHFTHSHNSSHSKVISLAQKIGIKKLYKIQYDSVQQEIMSKTNRRLQCMFCKRFMYRIAERIAENEKAEFIVSGENLGQVASQTLTNLSVNHKAVKMPILTPLLGFDKNETIKIAREIGTYDISIQKEASCPYVPQKPVTQVKESFLIEQESKLNVNGLVECALKNMVTL